MQAVAFFCCLSTRVSIIPPFFHTKRYIILKIYDL